MAKRKPVKEKASGRKTPIERMDIHIAASVIRHLTAAETHLHEARDLCTIAGEHHLAGAVSMAYAVTAMLRTGCGKKVRTIIFEP